MEFFLVVAFILGLASALLTITEEQVRQTATLDRAALAKSALDSVAHAANHVWLAGNGSRLTAEVFVPSSSICLLYNSTQRRLFCDVTARCPTNSSQTCFAYSEPVLPPGGVYLHTTNCPPYNALTGWYSIRLEHNGTTVNASCTRLT